ncbi:MAG: ERCC4 domain-containing protein, partial [Chloroflexota bacterium]|nr:ERCC4 domain-containing protein [Chloroflexota bacterium]
GEVLEEIERVPILAVHSHGKRVSVVLARATYKRCDLLFLTKSYKGRPSEQYEQIYWMTQQSMRQRRSQARLVSTASRHAFTVRIASDEKYRWSFGSATTERGKLPVGDYALMKDGAIAAVVERKTFENFLSDLSSTPVLHQRLLELAAYEHSALVVEAPYEDFLTPKKVHHLNATFCAAAIAECYALHPRLQVVFCSNRKTANEWTRNYFTAVWNALEDQPAHDAGRQVAGDARE